MRLFFGILSILEIPKYIYNNSRSAQQKVLDIDLLRNRWNSMSDVKSSENRTGWCRWWEGWLDLRVCSCEGFFLRLLRDLWLNVSPTSSPPWTCWDHVWCPGVMVLVKWRKWCSVTDQYLQSIFSTRYAHIRKPVRLKPCVQWTPLRQRQRVKKELLKRENAQ